MPDPTETEGASVATDPTLWDDADQGERYIVRLDLGYENELEPTGPPTPQDLTGKTVTFAIQPASGDEIKLTNGASGAAGSLVITDAPGGIVTVTLAPGTTRTLGSATWTLWVNPDGADADGVISGKIKSRKAVDGRA